MSMSDDPAGFRRGQPNDRRPPLNAPYSDDRRFGGATDTPRDPQREGARTQRFSTYQGGADAAGRSTTMRPPSAYAGYTLRPDQRGEPQRPADPRFDARPAEQRQERYSPSQESYGQSFAGEPRRSQTQRPTWEQAQQREAGSPSYPAYPGPGQTQRYAPQQPQTQTQTQYYPQTYNPTHDGRQGAPGAGEPTARYTDPESGYTPPAQAYDPNDYYRQGANDYQPNTYQPQSFDRGTATQRNSALWDSGPTERQANPATQRGSTQRGGSTQRYPAPEPQPPAPDMSYFTSDREEQDDQGLMGSADDATLQRFAPQAPQYAERDEETDPRAGNYPIARTQQDDDLDADFFNDDEDFDADEDTGGRGGRRKLVAAVLAGAMMVGGGGYYVLKHRHAGGDGSDVMTISQDGRAVKDAPANPGGKKFANGSKAIYDRLSMDGASGGQEGASQQASMTGGGGSIEERMDKALAQAKGGGQQTGATGQIGESPRTVSTFRVYPDGRTEEPQRTAAVENASANGEGEGGGSMTRTLNDATPTPPAQSEGEAPPPAQVQTPPTPAPTPAKGKTRGAKQATHTVVPGSEQTAPVAPPPTQVAAAAPSGNSWYAQVGARNDQNQALAAMQVVQNKYSGVLGNYAPVIHKADLGIKGTWYRVRVGPIEDKETASGLCEKLKGAGQKDCMVVKE